MPYLSVVIRTYTEARWDYLVAAVRSVERQTRPPDEIVIVVDHNPALAARVRDALSPRAIEPMGAGTRPEVVAVENLEAVGLSGAGNSGVRAARGEILVFIDDDATAAPDWLEQLERGYRDPRVMGVGGAILPVWESGRPGWFPDEFAWVVGCSYRGLPEVEASVRNLIGCNMSFRRAAFQAAGGFRGAESGIGRVGALPMGCEETEFAIRLRQQSPDGILLHRPRAQVFHQVPAKRTSWRYFLSRCYFEGRSKARVAQLVGSRDGLQSERAHVLRTLPRGVAAGVRDFAVGRDAGGLAKAAAIVVGLTWTTAGYLVEAFANRRVPRPPAVIRPSRVTGDQLR